MICFVVACYLFLFNFSLKKGVLPQYLVSGEDHSCPMVSPTPVEYSFVSFQIIWGYSSGHLCSLSHHRPTCQPHLLICICLGFHSLRFYPIFEPGLVFWIFFFLASSTFLYVWSNSNTSHHKCHAIMTGILLLLEWNL